MKAYDFEYDGRTLSSFGMVICQFGSKGLETISNGSQITFNTLSALGGSRHYLTSVEYEDCLESTIQICKNSCYRDVMEISSTEFRELTKWLNRKKFLKFKIFDEDYIDLYFEASFNISRIEIDGKLYGLELEIITNRPFALKELRTINIEFDAMTNTYTWKKYDVNYNIIEMAKTNLSLSSWSPTSSNYKYVQYADTYTIVDGAIKLTNSKKLTIDSTDDIDTIIGKYIYSEYHDNYYKIPSNATSLTRESTSSYTGLTTTYYMVSNAILLTIGDNMKGDFIENITSDTSNSYPTDGIQNEYYYVYTGSNFECYINDTSHEEGYIYPYMEIIVLEDGDLNIYNAIEDRDTYIANCVADEVIIMDYPVIQSSISSHNIQNDFNWNFFRIANTYKNSRNDLTISIPCTIKVKYSPIVKVGL